MKKKLPLSGSEKTFTKKKWGTTRGIGNNNCYAYAVNDYKRYRMMKSAPGHRNGRPIYSINCKELNKKVISDNPRKVYATKGSVKCKPKYYKIMAFVSTKPETDFHFYKQHGKVEWKVKKGDTHESIAKFLKVPITRVKYHGKLVIGKIIKIRANIWSHKQGWGTGPLLKDANGKSIKDPRIAGKNYGRVNYNNYCGSFCVKNRGIKVGHTYPKIGQKIF